MDWIRLSFRLTAFTGFIAATCLLAAALRLADLLCHQPANRNAWASACFRRAGQCLGWQIQIQGKPAQGNALYVANHISWSDIPALGGIVSVRFLSKAEVSRWPVIGWLARQAGTLFITRGGGQARRIKAEMTRHLNAGESILVFPEGTTSTGVSVLPMHGLLLSAAREAGVPVQPVTIGYRRGGRPDAVAPFVGDDSFHRHLLRLLRNPPARIDVVFHAPVPAAGSLNELNAHIRQQISHGLQQIHSGEFDSLPETPVKTTAAPDLSHLP